WKGWAIFLRQKQKKLIMLPSEIMIWQPEFTDKILSRKPGAVHFVLDNLNSSKFRKNNFAMTGKEFKESGMNCNPAKLFCYKSIILSLILKK
ncbi:hypothetical protein MMR81_25380, partial [Escherichia coli]|nr:hypothetical protein [Escherichia coli]